MGIRGLSLIQIGCIGATAPVVPCPRRGAAYTGPAEVLSYREWPNLTACMLLVRPSRVVREYLCIIIYPRCAHLAS
jgi:hypothetical protein